MRNIRKTSSPIAVLAVLIFAIIVMAVMMLSDIDLGSSNDSKLEITEIQQRESDSEGNARFYVSIRNNGGQSSSYPSISLEGEDGYCYTMYLSEEMMPEEYFDIIDIPGGEETWGIYVLDEYSYSDLIDQYCTVTLYDSDGDSGITEVYIE